MAVRTNSDFMPFDANEYRAIVNPTNLTIQAWGYGRRLVFQPGNVTNKKRACVQFVRTRIARKAVKNKRRLLELMTVEQGLRLIAFTEECGNFHEAYRKLTGRRVNKAGELLAEKQESDMLRRVLAAHHGIGNDLSGKWTNSDMRAILKDTTLVTDLDPITGRPRISNAAQGSVFDAVERSKFQRPSTFSQFLQEYEPGERLLDGTRRVGEGGLPGDSLSPEDFVVPERLTDEFRLPEEVASEATLAFDKKTGGKVAGQAPAHVAAMQKAFKGLQVAESRAVTESDLEQPLPEPRAIPEAQSPSNDRADVLALRNQIEQLGGKWSARSGADFLRDQLDTLTVASFQQAG